MNMHSSRPADGPARLRASLTQKADGFPGPVPIACVPPAGSRTRWGGEDLDGRPWALHITYRCEGRGERDALQIRTVRGSLDWTPVFETIEDLASLMTTWEPGSDPRRPEAPPTPTTLTIDGVPVTGTRIDTPGRSGALVDWQGQHVYCLGDPDLVDAVELRTGTPADFAAIDAEGAAFRAKIQERWADRPNDGSIE